MATPAEQWILGHFQSKDESPISLGKLAIIKESLRDVESNRVNNTDLPKKVIEDRINDLKKAELSQESLQNKRECQRLAKKAQSLCLLNRYLTTIVAFDNIGEISPKSCIEFAKNGDASTLDTLVAHLKELNSWSSKLADMKNTGKQFDENMTHLNRYIENSLNTKYEHIYKMLMEPFVYDEAKKQINWPSYDTLRLDSTEFKRFAASSRKYLSLLLKASVGPLPFFKELLKPVMVRFKYHFNSKSPIYNPAKPHLIYEYILTTLGNYEEFINCLQAYIPEIPILQCFLDTLLPTVIDKYNTWIDESKNQDVGMHYWHEILKVVDEFELKLSNTYPKEIVQSLKREIIIPSSAWSDWLQSEKSLALSKYDSFVQDAYAFELVYDIRNEQNPQPTTSSMEISDLLKTYHSDLCLIVQRRLRMQLIEEVHVSILLFYYNRLLDSYESFESIIDSKVPIPTGLYKEEDLALKGIDGQRRLCRLIGSLSHIIHFIDSFQWALLTMFDPFSDENIESLSRKYKSLLDDSTELLYRHLKSEIKKLLRPYVKIQTWSSNQAPASPVATESSISHHILPFFSFLNEDLKMIEKTLPRIQFADYVKFICAELETILLEQVIYTHQFSQRGSLQIARDIFELITLLTRYAGNDVEQQCENLITASHIMSLDCSQDLEDEKFTISKLRKSCNQKQTKVIDEFIASLPVRSNVDFVQKIMSRIL